jgi:hypothetical protein
MVFPIQRMSTIQNGIGKQHPLPRPRKTTIKQLRMERDGYSITINNIEWSNRRVGRVDVIRTNESRGITDFMGTLHNIQQYCVVPWERNIKMSDITWIMENIIVHYNTEALNFKCVVPLRKEWNSRRGIWNTIHFCTTRGLLILKHSQVA